MFIQIGNFTFEIIDGMEKIRRHQKDILTDVELLKNYQKSVISANDEKGGHFNKYIKCFHHTIRKKTIVSYFVTYS